MQEGFTRACEQHGFAFLRSESALQITAARSLTVGVTLGSTTVTSAALFVAADAGRQFRVGTSTPIYTIKSVTNASAVELDLAYSRDTDPAASAQILDAYATMPADFRRFLVIADPYNQTIIPFWLSEDELAIADPARTSSDTGPRYIFPRKYSSATATLGRVQYEYWPYPTSARSYPYLYYRAVDKLADSADLPGVFATRGDVLLAYVRSRCALWRGTTDLKNPGYDPNFGKMLRQEYDSEINRLILTDDNEYPQQLMLVNWARRYGAPAATTKWLRQTDATVNDYV